MPPKPVDLLQGTLNMLILKAVSLGPMHGYGVLVRIGQLNGEQLSSSRAHSTPPFAGLDCRRALRAKWAPSENNRRAKFYSLTDNGRTQLVNETKRFSRMARVVAAFSAPPKLLQPCPAQRRRAYEAP